MSSQKYFLVKADPKNDYSITDWAKDKTTLWDGVHNYQAINNIKNWSVGDIILMYHSQAEKRIVGYGKVVTKPTENKKDPRYSVAADVEFVAEFEEEQKPTLKEIKNQPQFAQFALVKQSRLSVMPVPEDFIKWLQKEKGIRL